jgi:hypothetical protein
VSCKNAADAIAEAYAEDGVPVRFLLPDIDPDAILGGTTAGGAVDTWETFAVEAAFSVQEMAFLSVTATDLKIRFAHPSKDTQGLSAALYDAILEPDKAAALLVELPRDDDLADALSYRWAGNLGRQRVGALVAHTWHLTRSGE